MSAIFWKEVKSYFYSPVAYVMIGLFTILTSLFFTLGNLSNQSADMNSLLESSIVFLCFIIPILTMRIIAEDRKNGTDVLLLTSPVSIVSVVLGKFFASYFVFLVLTFISFIYPIILVIMGAQVTPIMIMGYLGFLLLGAAFVAVGVFASSLSESQVVAAIIGFVSILIMIMADSISTSIGGFVGNVLGWFSLLTRYENFKNGILSLSSVVYYLSFVLVFLFLTVRMIEKRRWSQG